MAAWAGGDGEAGNQLIERHIALVCRFFRNKVALADVEDLVQQTFLGCLEAHTRYDGRASMTTFILAIARNQLFNYYRERRRSPLAERTSIRDEATSPTGALARLEDERLLLEALRQVPLDAQVLLELTYGEGMAGNEAAEVLGVSPSTLHTRLHRARENLRERVRELAPDRVALVEHARELLKREF
ncbi:MAG TPA: sigma-70 family RNA polymerase sigma factor [Polyangiales bacterium]|nr:sigma-70 family RNA polymerase sigma factor [Polyangiales bacterium]